MLLSTRSGDARYGSLYLGAALCRVGPGEYEIVAVSCDSRVTAGATADKIGDRDGR